MRTRCKDCGYLAIREKQTRELIEVDFPSRTEGKFPTHMIHMQHMSIPVDNCTLRPVCFRLEPKMLQESLSAEEGKESFMQIINNERECDRFIKWEQGFSPKEHAELDMFERQEQRQKDEASHSRRMHMIELTIVGLFVPAMMIVAQIITTRMQVAATIQAAHEAQAISQPPAAPAPIINVLPNTKSDEEIRDFVREELKTMTQYPPHPSAPPTPP